MKPSFCKCAAAVVLAVAVVVGLDDWLHSRPLDKGCRAGVGLGEETLQKDEESGNQAVVDTLYPFISRRLNGTLDDPNPEGVAKRVQHPIGWGCMKGKFKVDDALPPHLAQGILKAGVSYSASIRVAHNNFDPDSDPKGGSIAVKVFGAKGERIALPEYPRKLLELNKDAQDFIFISKPDGTFPFGVCPADFVGMHHAQMSGGVPAVLLRLLRYPLKFVKVLGMLLDGQALTNPFLTEFNTVQPHRLGGASTAAKFLLKPCDTRPMPPAPKGQPYFVRQIVQEHVAAEGVCMDVFVQRQRDACADPIENLLRAWSGPHEHVAQLVVPKGAETSASTCEFSTFNPWYGLEAHRPLGWVARTRRPVYKEAAITRMAMSNKCPHFK